MWRPNNKDGKIYALTLMQPWAYLMVAGHKENETRSWDLPKKFKDLLPLDLLIHSSVKIPSVGKASMKEPFFRPYCNNPGVLNIGKVVGKVTIVRTEKTTNIYPFAEMVEHKTAPYSCAIAYMNDPEYRFGNYLPDRFAWMTEPGSHLQFEFPFLATGRLGIWELSPAFFDDSYKG